MILFVDRHLQCDFRIRRGGRDHRMVDDLCQRFRRLESSVHRRVYVRNRPSHFHTGTAFQSVTLHPLDLYIGCLGSCVKGYKAGNKIIQFKYLLRLSVFENLYFLYLQPAISENLFRNKPVIINSIPSFYTDYKRKQQLYEKGYQ